jgi:ribosomal protein S18 acetylase RimI-like enzyme
MLLRPAQPADALAIARIHVRAWQHGYAGLLPASYLNQLRPQDRADKYDLSHADASHPHTIVALSEPPSGGSHAEQIADRLAEEKILGFATTAPSHESDLPHHGELTALYVDPDSWGRGIGVALVSAARAHLVSLGLKHAYLFTLVDNLRAQRFYQNDQWTADGLSRTDTVWGAAVHVLRFQRNL